MTASSADRSELTQLLADWGQNDPRSRDRALALVYSELRHMASGLLAESGRALTLQATALVNEALLKLLGHDASWDNRAHFFGVAARAMRQILVDYARRRGADKRGSGELLLDLDEALQVPVGDSVDLLALDAALEKLALLDAQLVQLVELRYFVGLSIEDTAKVSGLHPSAVNREWAMARAWLKRELAA
ncbi:ECF-type sigma factor [Tahibacter amnicola]|uniref:ECF-type sigma factor n=1 Tax=Tahibacter amnicola TaxID=2976241 RepID=A0ABY6BCQ2_9GAMM|nr:ECF-type sigma factor [Tahibacter amnicola]UXI66973.1 ECF-type sigma factor [Tahibacter amnicola]